jgi:anti-sigma factor RsiW
LIVDSADARPQDFPTRRVGAACVSDLALDRLAVGELAADDAAAVRTHLGACAACAHAFAAIEDDARRFAVEVDVAALARAATGSAAPAREGLASRLRRWRERWPRLAAVAPAMAAVAIAAVGLTVARPGAPPAEEGTRAKGAGLSLAAYVLADGAGVPYAGKPLAAGDRIAFRLASRRAGYVTVVGLDDRGAVSQYYPPGAATERVEAGDDVALRTAVELDDAPGRELVVAVRCDAAVPPSRVVEAARAALDRTRSAGGRAVDVGELGIGCAEARLVVAKLAPSP